MTPICRILLAEDNPTNQKVALLQLKKIGFSADTAANGTEVLKMCQSQDYDIILMDCQMPELDGYETTRILRQWCSEQPPRLRHSPRIIALTANALKGDRDKCLAAGMNDYLSKPVTLNELRDVLVRNWPGAKNAVATASKPPSPAKPLVDLQRFDSISRDAQGALDPDAFEIFRTAMMELPGRWDRLASRTGTELVKDAHQLKGMIAVFGFVHLADLLSQLEADAGTLTASEVVARVTEIRHACADSLTELARLVPELSAA
jgi:CheY-like chemotaxis protein